MTPEIFRHFVASFQSPWVKAYYDIGNHVRFAPPEQWILTLGDLIAKIHVKDYLLDPADPDGRGRSREHPRRAACAGPCCARRSSPSTTTAG